MRNQFILGTVTKDHARSRHSHTDQWENLFQCVGYTLCLMSWGCPCMAIKTRMPSLRNECATVLEYLVLGCSDVFRERGQHTGKWDNVSHVTTVYGATWVWRFHPNTIQAAVFPHSSGQVWLQGACQTLRLTETQVQGLMSRSSEPSGLKWSDLCPCPCPTLWGTLSSLSPLRCVFWAVFYC